MTLVVCVGAFVALIVPAMALYPGGTWWEPHAAGHRFWTNFLCDLEWRTALNGTPNPVGARLAEGAMLSLVLAFVPFWPVAARLFAARARLAAAVLRASHRSSPRTASIPLTETPSRPSDGNPREKRSRRCCGRRAGRGLSRWKTTGG